MENADEYRVVNPDLSDNDIKAFNINKGVWFKSTIAVCVIYGVVALGLLLLIIFSPPSSKFLTEDFRIFSLTFIGGIIFTIVLLVIQIMSFKPKILHPSPYDRDMCPDYWTLEKNTDASLTGDDKVTKRVKCVAPTPGYTAKTPAVRVDNNKYMNGTTEVTDTAVKKMYDILPNDTTNGTQNTPITKTINCSEVFPNYLVAKNVKDTELKGKPNALACAYAQQCGIPWTSMCPDHT